MVITMADARFNPALAALRNAVTGAILRGDAVAIVAKDADDTLDDLGRGGAT